MAMSITGPRDTHDFRDYNRLSLPDPTYPNPQPALQKQHNMHGFLALVLAISAVLSCFWLWFPPLGLCFCFCWSMSTRTAMGSS